MLTSRYTTVEVEFLHWLVLLIAAIAILLAVASVLAADPMSAKPMLPGDAGPPLSLAAADQRDRSFFPENPPLDARAAAKSAARLWMTLEHQQAGCAAEALAGWQEFRLPADTAVWSEIGMAAACVQMDDLAQALSRLERAEAIAPHHPLVAFLRGSVWARQAERMRTLPEGVRVEDETGRPMPAPMVEQAMFELMAIADLQEAIERAGIIDLNEPLVRMPPANGELAPGPRVGDLLVAIGADNFVGDAHGQLFRLHLGRTELAAAERHLTAAAAAGTALPDDHRRLAEVMLEEGLQTEAIRVLHQDLELNHPWMHRVCHELESLLLAKQPEWLW